MYETCTSIMVMCIQLDVPKTLYETCCSKKERTYSLYQWLLTYSRYRKDDDSGDEKLTPKLHGSKREREREDDARVWGGF